MDTAPGRQGGKSEHIGQIRAMSNDVGWDTTPVECINLFELTTLAGL